MLPSPPGIDLSRKCMVDDLYPGQIVRLLVEATFCAGTTLFTIPKGRVLLVLTKMNFEGPLPGFGFGQFLISKGIVAMYITFQPMHNVFEVVE